MRSGEPSPPGAVPHVCRPAPRVARRIRRGGRASPRRAPSWRAASIRWYLVGLVALSPGPRRPGPRRLRGPRSSTTGVCAIRRGRRRQASTSRACRTCSAVSSRDATISTRPSDSTAEGDETSRRLWPWPEPRGHSLWKLGLAQLVPRQSRERRTGVSARRNRFVSSTPGAAGRGRVSLWRSRGELSLAEDEVRRGLDPGLALARGRDPMPPAQARVAVRMRLQGAILGGAGTAGGRRASPDGVAGSGAHARDGARVLDRASSSRPRAHRLGRDGEAERSSPRRRTPIESIADEARHPAAAPEPSACRARWPTCSSTLGRTPPDDASCTSIAPPDRAPRPPYRRGHEDAEHSRASVDSLVSSSATARPSGQRGVRAVAKDPRPECAGGFKTRSKDEQRRTCKCREMYRAGAMSLTSAEGSYPNGS